MRFVIVGLFILLDIATGLLKAVSKGKIDSTMLRQGLWHKLAEVMAVACSYLVEFTMAYVELGVDLPVMNVVIVYLCITEFTSIAENLAEVNPTLNKLYGSYLNKMKEEQ